MKNGKIIFLKFNFIICFFLLTVQVQAIEQNIGVNIGDIFTYKKSHEGNLFPNWTPFSNELILTDEDRFKIEVISIQNITKYPHVEIIITSGNSYNKKENSTLDYFGSIIIYLEWERWEVWYPRSSGPFGGKDPNAPNDNFSISSERDLFSSTLEIYQRYTLKDSNENVIEIYKVNWEYVKETGVINKQDYYSKKTYENGTEVTAKYSIQLLSKTKTNPISGFTFNVIHGVFIYFIFSILKNRKRNFNNHLTKKAD